MLARYTIRWSIAIMVVLTFAIAQHLDSKDEAAQATASSLSMQDAIKARQMDLRFARAAEQLCGLGKPWRVTYDGALMCIPSKKGAL